jgi:two-component system, NarL family, invasion response regulator UvrY
MIQPKRISVLLVDDHAVVREGYRRLLECDADLVVVAEAATADEALQMDLEFKPKVTILDISLPGISGIEALRRLVARRAEARVLMFSMHQDRIYASQALRAGACGFVSKASAPDLLVQAVRAVAQGGHFLSPDIERTMRESGGERSMTDSLSARELEVLRLLIQGYEISEIGERLGLSPKTAANHQSSIKQKLGVSNALQLMLVAQQFGLIPGPRQ